MAKRGGKGWNNFIFGIVLVVIAVVILWVNERNYFETSDFLRELSNKIVEVPKEFVSNVPEKDESTSGLDFSSIEGKIIYANGIISASEYAYDEDMGVSGDFIILNRDVQYYQWKEKTIKEKDSDGNSSTGYEYTKVWSSSPISSYSFRNSFDHNNKVICNIPSETFYADDVKMGSLIFDDSALELMRCKHTPNISDFLSMNDRLNNEIPKSKIHCLKNQIYLGNFFGANDIGDVKITYDALLKGEYSIIGLFSDGVIKPLPEFKSAFMMYSGNVSYLDGIQISQHDTDAGVWNIRLLGLLMIFLGMLCMMNFMVKISNVVPLLGPIVKTGTFIASTVISISLSLFIISTAWVFYRPYIALVIIFVVAIIIFVTAFIANGMKNPFNAFNKKPKQF